MKKTILPLITLALLSPLAQAEKITSSIAGYQTVWIVDEKEFDYPLLNSQEPLTALIALKSSGKNFVDLLDDDLKITSATEDTGKTLDFKIWPFQKISKNKKTMIVELKGKTMPTPAAKAYTVKGTIPVLTGENSTKTKSPVIDVTEKSKVEFGKHFTATITKAGKPKWGDDALSVTLEYKFDNTKIRDFKFFDAAGNLVESKESSSGSSGFMGKKTYIQSYTFKKTHKKLIVEVDLWTDLEKTEVPFNVTVPLAR